MRRWFWLMGLAGVSLGGFMLVGCPEGGGDLCQGAACGLGDGSTTDGSPTCDPSKDPSCVSDTSGLFVSTSGSDSNAGTKEAPLKTVGAAVSKATGSKNSVYICAGTYAEHVKIAAAVNLYGGFACADWTYAATNKPKVVPSDVGYALDVEGVTDAVAIADLEFDAKSGQNAGDSSTAVFVSNSRNVTLRRVNAVAGDGVAGADSTPTSNFDAGTAPMGNSATSDAGFGNAGGLLCETTCGDGTISTGGAGGPGGLSGGAAGADGGPSIPENPPALVPPHNGTGGEACGGVGAHTGATGANASPGASGGAKAGTLSEGGWTVGHGTAGANGGVGQGGGGGGGGMAASDTGGGGGGCGGCGGAGGVGGMGGGSSFGVLIYQSSLTIDTCVLTAGKGADGKAGGGGQAGQTGGPRGNPIPTTGTGCAGGAGGNGGAAAGGGGGAGGNAIAIGYVGTKPTVTGATYAEGTAGAPGAGGTGAASNNGLSGVAGTKADLQELP